MVTGFELFQHTADMGIRVTAASCSGLVYPAAQGLYAIIGELVPEQGAAQTALFSFSSDDAAELLRDYLAELLYYFDHDRMMATGVRVLNFTAEKLEVEAVMEPVDPARSLFCREVKAVTYHNLSLVEKTLDQENPLFQAEVIVDI